jgi:hypothetical protein
MFWRSDLQYDPISDVYHCAGEKRLGTSNTMHEARRFCIVKANSTATYARLNRSAVRRSGFARFHAISTKPRVILRVRSLGPRPSSNQGASAKRSRCGRAHLKRILRLGRLRLSGPRGAQDGLFWPPSLRTCAGSQPWWRGERGKTATGTRSLARSLFITPTYFRLRS